MMQIDKSYVGAARHFPDQRPMFAPTPADETLVHEFLDDYYIDLDNAHGTMPEYVLYGIKTCIQQTAKDRGVRNRESFNARQNVDLDGVDPELLSGYNHGTNSFDQSIRFMKSVGARSIEGKRYTPKPHLRDAYYPELRTEARTEIERFDTNAALHAAEISKHRFVGLYNLVGSKKTIDGLLDYARLDHGYADAGRTIQVREKLHNIIRLDAQSEIHNISPLQHEKLSEDLTTSFVIAAEEARLEWEQALEDHEKNIAITLAAVGGLQEALAESEIYDPGFMDGVFIDIASRKAKIKFANVFMAKSNMLRDMIETALRDEYAPLPRWVTPVTTQLFVHDTSIASV